MLNVPRYLIRPYDGTWTGELSANESIWVIHSAGDMFPVYFIGKADTPLRALALYHYRKHKATEEPDTDFDILLETLLKGD